MDRSEPDRMVAVRIGRAYYPRPGYLRKGQPGAEHIQKDWTGGGTTCGFVPQWLWWRMGGMDAGMVNQYEPDTAFQYKDGRNISRIHGHSQFIRLGQGHENANDRDFLEGSIYPKEGDAIIINSGEDDDHVFVVLDEGDWESGTR